METWRCDYVPHLSAGIESYDGELWRTYVRMLSQADWNRHSNMIHVPRGYDSLTRHRVSPLLPLRTNDRRDPEEELFSQHHAEQSK